MMNRDSEANGFKQLEFQDKDLIMFTITDLRLEENKQQVHMVISLKRKIQTELLTTYLPTRPFHIHFLDALASHAFKLSVSQ